MVAGGCCADVALAGDLAGEAGNGTSDCWVSGAWEDGNWSYLGRSR